MRVFKWNAAHAVYLAEVDAEHRAIYQAAGDLHQASVGSAPAERILEIMRGLIAHSEDHFAHEERLMQSAHYQSYAWHKQSHDAARRRMGEFAARIEAGDTGAAEPLLEYLAGWLKDHVSVADRMMSAYVRNYQRAHPAA
jgi:hemerythrin